MDCFSNNFTSYTGTPSNNIPYLGGIDNKGTVYTCRSLNYSSSSPHNSDISTISETTIATATTTDIGHTDGKESEKERWRYNREARGYWNIMFPNGKRCLNSILWYCNDHSIRFGSITYYCKHNGHDCFASHHEPLVAKRWHVFPSRCFDVWCFNISLKWWLYRLLSWFNYDFHDNEAS